MGIGRFYAMVGALLWCPTDNKYLVLKRSEEKDFAAGTWECVTGRVDQGEGFAQAVHREVREELGVEVQIDFVVGTVHLYRGAARPENEMVGVQYCCSIQDPQAIHKSWEHSEHRWVTAREAGELLPEGHWLGRVIRRAETMRALMPSELLAYYRKVFES
ncbi:MAG: NUDIX domain-containing protein [Anaerolineae bacterium]|jgi:8-oxo-dGTP diphosphatase